MLEGLFSGGASPLTTVSLWPRMVFRVYTVGASPSSEAINLVGPGPSLLYSFPLICCLKEPVSPDSV